MTTTDPSAGQPVAEEAEPELSPVAKLAYAAIGAMSAHRDDRAQTLLLELTGEHGPQGVLEALRLLCSIPTGPLAHLCAEGAGGTVEIIVPEKKMSAAPDVWKTAADCASELLAGTFGGHHARLTNAFAMLNHRNQVQVLDLVAHYVVNVIEAAAAAGGEAWTQYDQAVQDRSTQPGWST